MCWVVFVHFMISCNRSFLKTLRALRSLGRFSGQIQKKLYVLNCWSLSKYLRPWIHPNFYASVNKLITQQGVSLFQTISMKPSRWPSWSTKQFGVCWPTIPIGSGRNFLVYMYGCLLYSTHIHVARHVGLK